MLSAHTTGNVYEALLNADVNDVDSMITAFDSRKRSGFRPGMSVLLHIFSFYQNYFVRVFYISIDFDQI
jgi:hypothetical protein